MPKLKLTEKIKSILPNKKEKKPHFLKQKNKNANLINTLKILGTALTIAVLGIVLFCGIANGWDSVARFFKGSYFCMILVLLLILGTAAIWIIYAVKKYKKVNDNETIQ